MRARAGAARLVRLNAGRARGGLGTFARDGAIDALFRREPDHSRASDFQFDASI
jgi:hypothetical protein